ncbi:MAG: hypothetical protein GX564_13215 [Oligosphaeraceae bacterium]|nr:hypothetical protein [Oligosphaeraceae bacterium]
MRTAVADKAPTLPPLSQTRPLVIFWLAVLTALVLLARTIWLAGREPAPSQPYTEELTVPGLRGSIFGPAGQCLARSIRQLGVFWYLPDELAAARESWQRYRAEPELAEILPAEDELAQLLGQRVRLAEEVSTKLLQLMSSLGEEEELRLEGFFIRQINCPPQLRERLGTVRIEAQTGLEVGVSGWEAEYDGQLRGRVQTLLQRPGGRLVLWDKTDMLFRSLNGRDVVIPVDKL